MEEGQTRTKTCVIEGRCAFISSEFLAIRNNMRFLPKFTSNVYPDLEFVKKFTQPNFRAKEFYTLKTHKSRLFLASNRQQKCIIISNLALFWLKLHKRCKFFNNYEQSLHLGVCKPAKYVRNCIVF